ncbi:MAG TPA: alpha/beta fold hydrolase, partial [Pseudoxanthomonas sp.]|nr:alpha/beta fold hydrolase [Pseudoxanthomonas sp.]
MPATDTAVSFLTEYGTRLHRRDWRAAQPRARILLVHGLGEHSGRYARLGEELSAAGFSVCAYDHRGHGQSEGARGVLEGHDTQLAHDLLDVFQAYAAEGDDLPFVFGHSLGGLVVLYASLVMGLAPRGLIVSSPALA